jgi:hypothetical protein
MARISKPLVDMVEKITESHTQIVGFLQRAEERQERQSRATIRALAAMQRASEENHRLLSKQVDDSMRYLAQVLERIVQTTDRTERMTGEILSRLAGLQDAEQ